MPATWTTPITWNVDQLVTNTDLNQQLRDNLEYLLSPNHQRIIRDNGGDYSITNVTTFQDIDSTNLSITLVTHGGPVWVHFQAVGQSNGTAHEGYLDIAIDGVRVGNSYTQGLAQIECDIAVWMTLPVVVLLTGLAAGTYTLRPQWRTASSNTVRLRASTTYAPIIFEAIEL